MYLLYVILDGLGCIREYRYDGNPTVCFVLLFYKLVIKGNAFTTCLVFETITKVSDFELRNASSFWPLCRPLSRCASLFRSKILLVSTDRIAIETKTTMMLVAISNWLLIFVSFICSPYI